MKKKALSTILIGTLIFINTFDSFSQTAGANLNQAAMSNYRELYTKSLTDIRTSDPELFEVFVNFAFDEVLPYGSLDTKTRVMAILASTIASGALSEYKNILIGGLDLVLTPNEAREIVYQAVPYVGFSKVSPFIQATNEIFNDRGISLPLEKQSTTTPETRFEIGLAVQKEIFGDRIDINYKNSPSNQIHIQRFLSANCFGDYVARGVLDLKTREMLTFSMLMSLGGCEPQLKGHIQGNLNMGNDKEFLLTIVTHLIPYVGYPRALNAIACLNEVVPE